MREWQLQCGSVVNNRAADRNARYSLHCLSWTCSRFRRKRSGSGHKIALRPLTLKVSLGYLPFVNVEGDAVLLSDRSEAPLD